MAGSVVPIFYVALLPDASNISKLLLNYRYPNHIAVNDYFYLFVFLNIKGINFFTWLSAMLKLNRTGLGVFSLPPAKTRS
jgi:hypothetical protein